MRLFQTDLGPIAYNAALQNRRSPLILCIRGAWAPEAAQNELFQEFPDHEVVVGDLPGMERKPLKTGLPISSCSVRVFAQMYDKMLEHLPGRDVVVVGVSTGALVALGMRSPRISGRLLVEPFLRIAPAWPLIDNVRERIRDGGAGVAAYVDGVFGIGLDEVADRDYGDLLAGAQGLLLSLVGEEPLGARRDAKPWPSLADEWTREQLRTRGTVVEVPGGHHLLGAAQGHRLFVELLRQMVATVDENRRAGADGNGPSS